MLSLAIMVINAGWFGTERICYLRAFRGQSITAPELGRFTRAFIMRYAVLGLIVVVPFVLLLLPAFLDTRSEGPRTDLLVAMVILITIVDLALTFVTPALAFSTRRVRGAIGIGLRMIRSEWPRSAWYILVPPLTVVFVGQTISRVTDVGIAGQAFAGVLAPLVNLWFKGATAAFYLRRHEVGDDGAAFEERHQTQPF